MFGLGGPEVKGGPEEEEIEAIPDIAILWEDRTTTYPR